MVCNDFRDGKRREILKTPCLGSCFRCCYRGVLAGRVAVLMIEITLTALSWLTGSITGRYVAIGSIVVLAILWALYSARRGGIKAEQARQLSQSLDNLRNRIKTDDEISSLSPDARRERLREWFTE